MSDSGSKMKNNESSNNFRTAHSTTQFHFHEQEEPPFGPTNIKHSTQKEWPVFQRQLKHMVKFNFLNLRQRFCIPSLYLPR